MSEERLGLSTTEPFTPLAFVEADTAVDRIRAVDDLGANGPLLIVASFRRAQQFIAAVRHGSGPATPPSRRSDRRDDPLGPECPQLSTVVSLLTPLERSMLHLLMSEEGRVWSFDELTRHAWRTERGDASRVHALVKRLRAKLAEARVPLTIESVRGVGFRVVRTAADDATTRPRGHPRDPSTTRRSRPSPSGGPREPRGDSMPITGAAKDFLGDGSGQETGAPPPPRMWMWLTPRVCGPTSPSAAMCW